MGYFSNGKMFNKKILFIFFLSEYNTDYQQYSCMSGLRFYMYDFIALQYKNSGLNKCSF